MARRVQKTRPCLQQICSLKFVHPYVNQLQDIYIKLTLRDRQPGYRQQPEMATSQRVFLHPHNRNNYQLSFNR
jgi:hypothetical protein